MVTLLKVLQNLITTQVSYRTSDTLGNHVKNNKITIKKESKFGSSRKEFWYMNEGTLCNITEELAYADHVIIKESYFLITTFYS